MTTFQCTSLPMLTVSQLLLASIHHHHQFAEAFVPASSSISTTSSKSSLKSTNNHEHIIEAIDELFPPQGLDQRTALSRKDGYWPFISTGDEPPQELVYGEFDVGFFAQVLDRAILLQQDKKDELTFCDLGSGTGRLVLTAAALHPWKLVRGVELLPGIHEQAVEKLENCQSSSRVTNEATSAPATPGPNELLLPMHDSVWKQYRTFSPSDDWLNQLSRNFDDDDGSGDNVEIEDIQQDETGNIPSYNTEPASSTPDFPDCYTLGENIPLAPIQLRCGSFDDPYEFFGDADIVFCFSSAMPYHIIINMARAVGRQCKPGTLVITTEYSLPTGGTIDPFPDDPNVPFGEYELELVEEMNGYCDATGGESTVFVHRLTKSLGTGFPRKTGIGRE